MERMGKMRDLRVKQAATPEQKPQEDWRKKALYNIQQNSEAAQERTSSSSKRDLEPDVDIASPSKRQQLRNQRWLENRGSVTAASSESQIHESRFQEVKAGSRPNENKSNPSKLGPRKGWTGEAIGHFERWHKGESEDPYLDLVRCQQDQYIQNNYRTESEN